MKGTTMLMQTNPQQLREELQEGDTPDLRLRRAIIGLSLVGMASMAIVSLFQTGVIKHLPDPPLDRFDSLPRRPIIGVFQMARYRWRAMP